MPGGENCMEDQPPAFAAPPVTESEVGNQSGGTHALHADKRDTLVQLREVSLAFPGTQAPVLTELSLSVRRGELLTIVGPSGGGKSTLLRLIAGLLHPSAGDVVFSSVAADQGEVAPAESGMRARRRADAAGQVLEAAGRTALSFGFVFQQATLLPWRTAMQNLLLPLELEGGRKAHVPRDAAASLGMLRRVGLSAADADKRPAEMSGGMQMRLSLARALMSSPDVLLLDEPLAAVDDLLRMRLQEDIRRLHEDLRLTTVLVTHNLLEAVFMSDRVLVLTGRPARVQQEMTVASAEPRNQKFRQSAEYHMLVDQLTNQLLGPDQSAT